MMKKYKQYLGKGSAILQVLYGGLALTCNT